MLTFAREGLRVVHEGRKSTPVYRTAYTNAPSLRRSRRSTARQASVSEKIAEPCSIAMVAMICSLRKTAAT
jgi:hypothetical protein